MPARFEPLARSELDAIHGATLRVLESTGVRILAPEAAELLAAAGASYDPGTAVVRIPEEALKDCIGRAPGRFRLYGRGPDRVLAFGEGHTYMSPMGTAVQVEDLDGHVRPAALKDVESFYRLVDASPQFDHASWIVWPQDVPEDVAHLHEILSGFRHTTKSLDGFNWGTERSREAVEMGAIVAGGPEALAKRPLLLGFVNPVSPLTLAKEMTEGLLVFARSGQPCIVAPECLAGGTAPATLAGLLVQQNAEVLAGIAVAECARPGAPVLYGSASTVMDMRTGAAAFGAPEAGLIMAATAQLARYHGIPSRATGGSTEALGPDYQAGVESATTLLLAALAGSDFIYDAGGSLESTLTASYAKLLLDEELCGEVRRIVAGIRVAEDSLARETIEAVGSRGGYLGHPHTRAHFRREHYLPVLFQRAIRGGREAPSKGEVLEEARRRCRKILEGHAPDPSLDPAVERDLVAYVKHVEKRSSSGPSGRTSG